MDEYRGIYSEAEKRKKKEKPIVSQVWINEKFNILV